MCGRDFSASAGRINFQLSDIFLYVAAIVGTESTPGNVQLCLWDIVWGVS
jgi:hypothetical protein